MIYAQYAIMTDEIRGWMIIKSDIREISFLIFLLYSDHFLIILSDRARVSFINFPSAECS